jgi:KDO2-lipid IV(A) lauroyltransferase
MLPSPADVRQALRLDSAFWRRAMTAGISFGPEPFVRYSPPLFGLAFGAALAEKRNAVRANLDRILGARPPLQELRDVGEVFSNYASCLTEAILLGSERGAQLTSSTRGVDRYFASAAEGRGVIIVTAHTGGWEIAGPVLSGVHPADVIVVMQRERDERARAIQDAVRLRTGVKVFHMGDSPLDALPLLRQLRDRSVVALQIDRVPPGIRTRQTTFLGLPWLLPDGPFALAALSGAPILPVFTRRVGFMHYEAIVEPPIRVLRRPSAADLDQAARSVAGAMERFVRAYPTQWFHFV